MKRISIEARFVVRFEQRITDAQFAALESGDTHIEEIVDETKAYDLAPTTGEADYEWDIVPPNPRPRRKKPKPKSLSTKQLAMLRSIRDHGDPLHNVYGQTARGADGTHTSLIRRNLIASYLRPVWHLTDLGAAVLAGIRSP